MRVHPSSSQLKGLCRESWHRRVCPWGRHISGVFLSNGNLTEFVTSHLFPYAEVRFLSSLTEVTARVTECNKIKKCHKCLVLNTGLPVLIYQALLGKLLLRSIIKKKCFHVCVL